jgi:hypothetical protein
MRAHVVAAALLGGAALIGDMPSAIAQRAPTLSCSQSFHGEIVARAVLRTTVKIAKGTTVFIRVDYAYPAYADETATIQLQNDVPMGGVFQTLASFRVPFTCTATIARRAP